MKLIDIAVRTADKATRRGASQAEASLFEADNSVTRYSRNNIHQNIRQKNYYVNLEAVVDGNKIGSTALHSFEEKAIDEGVERALKIARVSTPDPEFRSLPAPKRIAPLEGIFSKRTAEATAEEKAESVKTIIETALSYSKLVRWSAGAYSTELVGFAIANSLGLEAETAYTRASIDVIVTAGENGGEGSGHRAQRSRDVGDFGFEELALAAAKDAVDSVNPTQIPLGEYEAILLPEAVSTLTSLVGSMGFSAAAHQEGHSFLQDKLGVEVFDEKLTILDNGRSLKTLNALPFDGEGVPKRALMLVNGGVAENLCYDAYTAAREGRESTGHAPPKLERGTRAIGAREPRGMPLPVNQVIEPGDATVEEMVEETRRGVMITRLHYANPVRRDLAVISGLTRDAFWLIENGEVKRPSRVMRFTDSIPGMLGDVEAVGGQSTVARAGDHGASAVVPALKIAHLSLTGHSEF